MSRPLSLESPQGVRIGSRGPATVFLICNRRKLPRGTNQPTNRSDGEIVAMD